MKRSVAAFLCGAVFSAGLVLSGMTQPSKIVAFLDFFGHWDPSLALVMVGAIGVYMPAYVWIRRREGAPLALGPEDRRIDAPLVGGAVLFGAGWGAAGYCPGPAVVSVATATVPALLFVAGMVGGTLLCHALASSRSAPDCSAAPGALG